MVNLVKFFVVGEPRPKQSFRVSGRGRGRGYQPARVKAWQTDIAWEAEQAMRAIGRHAEPFDSGLLAVDIIFTLGNQRRVDLDNLCKAVLDGLNGICFADDRQIVDLHLVKEIAAKGDPVGCSISVLRKVGK